MILARSAQVITGLFKVYPFFSSDSALCVPNTWLRALNASFVNITNLPRCPPGASWRIFNLWTLHTSTPGRFLAAYLTSLDSSL
jgi:hypothetical protein